MTAAISEIIDLVQKTSGDFQLESCLLDSSTSIEEDPRAVRQTVLDFVQRHPHTRGWLCFQSAVRHFTHGEVPHCGIIQYGELGADNHGLLIRRAPNNKWRLVELQEGEGDTVIAQTCQHVGRRDMWNHQNFELVYRRYWKVDNEFGCLPHVARFVDFQMTGGDV